MKYLLAISSICMLSSTDIQSMCKLRPALKNAATSIVQKRRYNAGFPEHEDHSRIKQQNEQLIQQLEVQKKIISMQVQRIIEKNNLIIQQDNKLAELKWELAQKHEITNDASRHYIERHNMHYGNQTDNE